MVYNKISICLFAIFALSTSSVMALPHTEFYMTFGGEKGLFHEFLNFMEQYEKDYHESEFYHRYEIFKENLQFIFNHNSQHNMNYTVAVNRFADLTLDEFRESFGGFNTHTIQYRTQDKHFLGFHNVSGNTPSSVNWVQKGAVTPVKNQEQCGSCWAFSTTGAMEGAHYLKNNELLSFSEQQFVDCDHNGDMGCNGGLPSQAIEYAVDNGGVETETNYPYTGQDGECTFVEREVAGKFTGYQSVESNNNQALMSAVAQQPVSVAINAIQASFQFYSSGVYDDPSCPSSMQDLDHAVLAVGYDTENGKDYWLVKNSWSTQWGDNGYIKMARGNDVNTCGILDVPVYPVAA